MLINHDNKFPNGTKLKKYFLNTTDSYHKYKLDSLGWEITLSIMLEDPRSPCRDILKKSDSFGDLLYDFLSTAIPIDRIQQLIEIGGGYGYLMRDFLRRNDRFSATMVDLSPFLLTRQQEALRGFAVKFIQEDFLELNNSILCDIDLAILNEVIGDFPTACEVSRNLLFLEFPEPEERLLQEMRRIYKCYSISPPVAESFAINTGAIQALEKLCIARVPYIYVSEHSCEACVPEDLKGLMDLNPTGNPERIRLRGHNEYTIRFSDLEKVATYFGYDTERGSYFDIISPVIDDEVAFILRLGASRIDRYEIIQQFIEDLAKYEYLILSLPPQI